MEQNDTINYISPTVDTRTASVIVRIALPDTVALKPGQAVDINFIVEQLNQAITLPRKSLVSIGDQSFVWKIIEQQGHRISVEVNPWPDGDLVITSGVASGDVIILDHTSLIEGQSVRVAD